MKNKSIIGYLINKAGYALLPIYPLPFIKYLKGKQGLKGVEIGTFEGRNAASILSMLSIESLHCVDSYLPYMDTKEYTLGMLKYAEKQAERKLGKFPVASRIKKTSMEAIGDFEDKSLDFVYIDGSHNYEEVKKDLQWFSKVKKGGILSGHDIHVPDVSKAVMEFVTEKNLNLNIDYPDWVIHA